MIGYSKPYPNEYDLIPLPPKYRLPDFTKFSGSEGTSSIEHVSRYLAQLGMVSASDELRVRFFSQSLTGPAFGWYTSLPPDSVRTWKQLEEQFHIQYHSEATEAGIADLTQVRQRRGETVSEYIQRFRTKLTSYEQRHPELYQDKFKRVALIEMEEDEDSVGDQEVAVAEWTRGAKPMSCKWVKQPGPAKGIDLAGDGKLGYGFTSADELEEIDIGPGDKPRPTFISKKLDPQLRSQLIALLKEYPDCFAWDYTEMPGLDRSIIEHRLPLKKGFRPFQQRARQMKAEILVEVKKEIQKMLDAGFIRPCRYAEWISNVVPVEKKDGRWRVAIDFRNLNSATPKDEYPMPVAETLINAAAGHKVLSFMDGNAGYNQIFMAPEDINKTAFRVPGSVGLFEYVVMTFGLKNAGATYQRAMNYIFHDLIGKLVEIYIDDVVVKSVSVDGHLEDLRHVLDRTRKFGLRMNPKKCAFGVTASSWDSWFMNAELRSA
ncbi:hypothetical protein QYE76_023676 [Lolium multiflorum]|uniref:Gag-pol polyprotein n=1 Tax=Lolium multiflorum TaxID=4521 RepID=A0AAD8RDQ1_LOLMU|nr:hypothetical protein QYE76_023676 [Lolium multiflorum]